jgi:exonuclease III
VNNPDPFPDLNLDPNPNLDLNLNPLFNPNHEADLNFPILSNDHLSFSTQNVRSMNISTKNDITLQKILAICNLKTDFIFLSDLRLNSVKQIASLNDLKKRFFFNGYKLLHNSSLPSRGVGILVSKKFNEQNFTILNTVATADCNSLIIHVRIQGRDFLLASVYGPNHDNETHFYDELRTNLQRFNCPMIIGGDWNATFDCSDVGSNLDTVNMRNIPSLVRSIRINELSRDFSLLDPFRYLYPEKKEYTFIPTSVNEHNRSRLDFFLVSHSICNPNTSCIIPHSLSSTFFDHKPVTLWISGKRKCNKNIVKDTILNNADLPAYVKASVFECYLQHWVPGPNMDGTVTTDVDVREKLHSIGRIHLLLNEIKTMESTIALNGTNNLNDLILEGKRAEILLIFEDLPDFLRRWLIA